MIARLAHRAWVALNHERWDSFRRALDDPEEAQEQLLRSYLRDNAGTFVGNRYLFSTIDSISSFQKTVPIVSYENIEPDIATLRRGVQDVLTREPVQKLVPSSGSSTTHKLIPYNRRSRREFQRAVGPWIADLDRRRPGALAGRAYWAPSPLAEAFDDEPSEVPIGFNDDSAYFGGPAQRLVHRVLAVPSSVRDIEDLDEFCYTTLKYLLRARDLSLISVWNPAFFTFLLDALPANWDRLLRDLPRRRALELKKIGPESPAAFWPDLEVISCWKDSHAATVARKLGEIFPNADVEAKGLLATEAVVTVPFEEQRPLAVRSHFFEFLDNSGCPHIATDLEMDGEYDVVVTTGSGLYRYRLGDRVRVTGFLGRTPCLSFLGKTDKISNRLGEGLTDGHVAACMRRVLAPLDINTRFSMLAPFKQGEHLCYTLFIEVEGGLSDHLAGEIAAQLDQALMTGPDYRRCRQEGQLAPIQIFRIAGGGHRAYMHYMCSQGQRLSDIKPAVLDARSGWSNRFEPM